MAGKKNGRTSKTDHVLSLLTGTGQDSAAAAPRQEAARAAAPEAAPETAPAAPKTTSSTRHNLAPILDVARANQEALSETIREALEESLEAETAAAAPAAEEPAPEPAAAKDEEVPALALESEPEPIAEEPSAPAEQPAPKEAAAPAEEAPAPEDLPEEEDFVSLNIMEPLVEQRMNKYIGMFGLCDCSRCKADVRALALSRLPPKYMVLSKAALTPMVSFFSAKYDTSATAQVIYACKQVMEHPRHRR